MIDPVEDPPETPAPTPTPDDQNAPADSSQPDDSGETAQAAAAINSALVTLGFVSFDSSATDNATTGVLVSEQRRREFRRDVYVGIRDGEQRKEFIGRVVEGPFHLPHEVSVDSAITRTTLLNPERTRFRPTYFAYGSIEIIGELADGERVVPTSTRPRPYSEIYVFPADRLRVMLGIEGDFLLGQLMGYRGIEVKTDSSSKNFLPRNVGVFGTVGSGKSNTIQTLMEEALKVGWAVIVIDVEGEYVRMNEPSSDRVLARALQEGFGLSPKGVDNFRVYVPSAGDSGAASPTRFKCPLAGIEPEILADILELSEPQVRMFGTITANALRRAQQQAGGGAARQGVFGQGQAQAQAPARPYTLQSLITGLTEDATGNIPLVPGIQNYERPTASTLRGKLINLGRSQMLDWNQTNNVPELPILDLLEAGRLSVLDVSETDDRSRNIAIAYTLQSLFDRVIETSLGTNMTNGRPRPRVLAVIEEVHTFVSKAAAPRMRAVLDKLQVISRRGRKRWMALGLVSQQPGHVPDELFELTNTRFIHQLKSVSNLTPIKATTGGVHEALWSTVPSLAPGQCLVTGAVFRNALFVDIRPALSRRLLSGD